MATRNFWIKADIDGRKMKLEGGPRSRDGGFTLSVQQRDEGDRPVVLRVEGKADSDGYLHLYVWSDEWPIELVKTTHR